MPAPHLITSPQNTFGISAIRRKDDAKQHTLVDAFLFGRVCTESHDDCAADEGDMIAFSKLHSITSSASDSKLSESFKPSALAVCRLIAISNLMGCNTGISAGFAPVRTLPA